jgi:polyhydroxybutyrate depolymerase
MDQAKRIFGLSDLKWKTGLIFICLVGYFACEKKNPVEPGFDTSPGDYEISVQVDTTTRWFKLVIPDSYDHTEARPLLFCFHGGNRSMDIFFNDRKDLINRCAQENWILVFPNGSSAAGNKGPATWSAVHCCAPAFNYNVDETGFVMSMLDTLTASLMIDTTRIYATGSSNGGMLTHRLAADIPDVFAAVAPVNATIGGQADSLSPVVTVQPSQPIPIIITNGMSDLTVNFNGGLSDNEVRIDISFRESVLFWANNNQCAVNDPDTTVVDGLDGKVWIVTFKGCSLGAEVQGVAIQNYGHGWPSLQSAGFDATNNIVDFLKRFGR